MDNETTNELPIFPATAPAVFRDRDAATSMMATALERLADVAVVPADRLDGPTPCEGFTVAELQHHVLGWLQFFAAAVSDPDGAAERIDPATWQVGADDDPVAIVGHAASTIEQAIAGGVTDRLVVMNEARMSGDSVIAMALGEYLVHGWDLAVSTGRTIEVDETAAEPALEFLQGTVAPEYRGPDTGFFDAEVPAPAGASAFTRLLCFGGRSPDWAPSAS